jgi:RNA polymerase sigma-70 factor, ECF subfamily
MCELATGNPDDALDLIQDAACDFVRRYATRPAEEWAVLYYRIVQSRITDWHRRSTVRNRFRVWFGRNDEDDTEDPVQTLPDREGPDPAESLVRRDMADKLQKALRQLPLRQRQAFLLRAWEGLSVEETATVMGCSGGSVKTHYFRAVQVLRQVLEEFRP